MKFFLFVLFSVCYFSASAQWYRLDFKKHTRPQAIDSAAGRLIVNLPNLNISNYKLITQPLGRSEYSLNAIEYLMIKTAQHNMRFRIYNDASYNFSDLATLYIKQNRYAEAKWFLLQSNNISRQENDDKHTIANLIDLASIKAGLGDYAQAQQDLSEARILANIRGFKDDEAIIQKKILYYKQTMHTAPKVDVRYAELPQNTPKTQ